MGGGERGGGKENQGRARLYSSRKLLPSQKEEGGLTRRPSRCKFDSVLKSHLQIALVDRNRMNDAGNTAKKYSFGYFLFPVCKMKQFFLGFELACNRTRTLVWFLFLKKLRRTKLSPNEEGTYERKGLCDYGVTQILTISI